PSSRPCSTQPTATTHARACSRRSTRTISSSATGMSARTRRIRARSSKARRANGCSRGSRRSSTASSRCRGPISSFCSTRRSRWRGGSWRSSRHAATRRSRRTSTRRTSSTRALRLARGRNGGRRRRAARRRRGRGRDLARGGAAARMTFTGVAEQHEAKRLLSAALADGPAHAYLLHGPPGVGKRALALLFAAELLGEHARVERRTHPDLYVLEPLGDQIRIDDIRTLRRDLHMRPYEASRRVYLVFGADTMNEDAADALLKDLEEPPAYAVIVL